MAGETYILYFAYGSNMSAARLKARTPSAERFENAVLRDHRLAFHKRSSVDGSGKCNIVAAERELVLGVAFNVPVAELDELDAHEGRGYDRMSIEIELASGTKARAETYKATAIDPSLKPYPWYLRHVLEGARQAGLPREYICMLEAIETVADPDPQRERRELEIYGCKSARLDS